MPEIEVMERCTPSQIFERVKSIQPGETLCIRIKNLSSHDANVLIAMADDSAAEGVKLIHFFNITQRGEGDQIKFEGTLEVCFGFNVRTFAQFMHQLFPEEKQ